MEGSERLDELSPSYGVASATVLMCRRGVANIAFQNSQLTPQSAGTVIAVLCHLVSSHAAMAGKQVHEEEKRE